MDMHYNEVISFIISSRSPEILCPDYAFNNVSETFKGSEVIPYCAATRFSESLGSTAIIHKGLLERISVAYLTKLIAKFDVVFANEVFVVFRNDGRLHQTHRINPEIHIHTKPIYEFVKNWGLQNKSSKKTKAVIVSAWNVGNVGDDAVSLSAESILQNAGIEQVFKIGPNGDFSLINDADLLVVGGGGIIYDSDLNNVSNYTSPVIYASDREIPVIVLGVGTQGLNTKIGKAAFKSALSRASLITVRDIEDRNVLKEECDIENVHATADLAFSLQLRKFALNAKKNKGADFEGVRKLVLISLSKLIDSTIGDQTYTFNLCCSIISDLTQKNYEVVLIEHSEDDRILYSEIISHTGVRKIVLADIGVRATIELYAIADIVFTSRFHGIVFCSLAKTKVAIFCSPKSKSGRLINHDLNSLGSSVCFLGPSMPGYTTMQLLDMARVPDQSEVDALCSRFEKNSELVRRLISSIVRKGDFFVKIHESNDIIESTDGSKSMNVSTTEGTLIPAPKEDKVSLKAAADLAPRIDNAIDKEMKKRIDRFFIESINDNQIILASKLFMDSHYKYLSEKISQASGVLEVENLDTAIGWSGEKREIVSLVLIEGSEVKQTKKILDAFSNASIYCDNFNMISVGEDGIRSLSMAVGLKNIQMQIPSSTDLVTIPIFDLANYEGDLFLVK